jgi:L-iditol 2-dehydrogenase
MKRIVLVSPRTFRTEEVPTPTPGPGEALVRIGKVGVCGSDIHLYRHGHIGDIVITSPLAIGHECMGVVSATGPGVDAALVGKRVAVEPQFFCGICRWCVAGKTNVCPKQSFIGLPPRDGAMQEYMVHPANLLKTLPDSISDESGVVLEPLAVALHAVNLAKIRQGQTVVVLGTGVIGTLVLMVLRLYRGVRVICVDILKERLDRARRMGAAVVPAVSGQAKAAVAGIMRECGPGGADVVFECAGTDDTLWAMCEVASPAGHVAVVGTHPENRISFSSGSARRKGLTLRFVRRSLNTLSNCIELTASGALDAGQIVTHTFAATQATEAFDTVDGYKDGVLKAIIDMEKWQAERGAHNG